MEGLGKKLQEARLARNLTLEEAGRMTKIRPGRLQEIENEDFSGFASLAYAKGFLLIYGKFLDVDVSPYLEAFETSESVTVDGYSYLQDNPAPKPSRPVVVRKHSGGGRGSFVPFVIGVIVLVVGFVGMKWILEVQRLKPSPRPVVGASPTATAAPGENHRAPRFAGRERGQSDTGNRDHANDAAHRRRSLADSAAERVRTRSAPSRNRCIRRTCRRRSPVLRRPSGGNCAARLQVRG